MQVQRILWRRVDSPGHDACRLVRLDSGWRLDGFAAYRHEDGAPVGLAYEAECDEAWRTVSGAVQGWFERNPLDLRIGRSPAGDWTVNDRVMPGLEGCVDLDLGFTPATNLFQMRRVALRAGESAEVPAAWLDVPDGALEVLHQRYECRSDDEYRYEAPQFGYAATLRIGPSGFIESYPGLWEVEPEITGETFTGETGNPV